MGTRQIIHKSNFSSTVAGSNINKENATFMSNKSLAQINSESDEQIMMLPESANNSLNIEMVVKK